jgi:hypothetical protein
MLSVKLKKTDEDLKVFRRGALFTGAVPQKSLMGVVLASEKPEEPHASADADESVKPRKCHGACKNFSAAQYGTGSCALDKCPVVPDEEGCRDWESTGDDRLLADAVSKRTKYLAGV